MEYSCTMCPYVTKYHKDFCNHIVRVHKSDPRFLVYCQVDCCGFSTKSWNSYKQHVSAYHKEVALNENINIDNNDYNIEHQDILLNPNNEALDFNQTYINATYLLSLETKHNLSQAAISIVAENTSDLIKRHIELFKMKIRNQIQINRPENIDEILNDDTDECYFEDLLSEHRRLAFYEKHFKMISTKSIVLGHHLKKSKNVVSRVKDHGYIIPLRELVAALHNLPEFLYWCQHTHVSQGNLMTDICDGQYVKNNPFFQQNPNALQIVLYNDDIEIVNPLGTHVKKHKITLFYATFANIPPEYRSKLQSIFLVAVAKSKYLKKHGVKKLLKDFIETVNIMSSMGLPVEVNGLNLRVKGAVVMAPADTPAANNLGGFKEGVGFAYKKCRTCLISKNELSRVFRDEYFNLRTHTDYVNKCDLLNGDMSKDARKYWSKMWGINKKSCLTELYEFDIIECLVHDPMHVLLEGLLPYELALLLTYCIQIKKYFTLSWINSQIESFPYTSLTDSSKPEIIQRKHIFIETHVKQTSAAMLTLIGILPFILGKKIQKGDSKWVLFLNLVQITYMCTTHLVSKETVEDLRNLIEKHHTNFRKEYPKASVPPKMHFLIHIVQQILRFGPGKFQWCMRFEAKHAFFKNKKWKCFKNLAFSMAKYHQKWLCGQMMTSLGTFSENFFYAGDEASKGQEIELVEMNAAQKLCIQETFPHIESVFVTKQVKIHGCTFKDGCILIESIEDNIPTFACIRNVLIKDQIKYFLVQKTNIIYFDEHTLSFQVEFEETFKLIKYHDLFVKLPLDMNFYDNKACVLNKYAFISMDLE